MSKEDKNLALSIELVRYQHFLSFEGIYNSTCGTCKFFEMEFDDDGCVNDIGTCRKDCPGKSELEKVSGRTDVSHFILHQDSGIKYKRLVEIKIK